MDFFALLFAYWKFIIKQEKSILGCIFLSNMSMLVQKAQVKKVCSCALYLYIHKSFWCIQYYFLYKNLERKINISIRISTPYGNSHINLWASNLYTHMRLVKYCTIIYVDRHMMMYEYECIVYICFKSAQVFNYVWFSRVS